MMSTHSPKKPSTPDVEPRHTSEKESGEISDETPSRKSEQRHSLRKPAEPPLPAEEAPPLPDEPPPASIRDDGWEAIWDSSAQAFYFFNRVTQISQWDNPRVPETDQQGPPGVGQHDRIENRIDPSSTKPTGGYDPAIHGDYDPNADYAKIYELSKEETGGDYQNADQADAYAATGSFNRFTGKWQKSDINPEKFSDENKSLRQMNAFFDVDSVAGSHDGKSLKAERANKKLSKKELQAFKDKRREKKEEKRRAWLRD